MRRLAQQKGIAKEHDMTYKSSAHDACKAAGLSKIDVLLPVRQKAWRYVFASPRFIDWLNLCVPKIVLHRSEEDDTLLVQIETEFFSFSRGDYLRDPDDVRRLDPQPDGVWELKTPDLRLFGWFPERDHFIVHMAHEKEGMKWKDYEPLIKEVCEFRAGLTAVLRNYIAGGLWNVVSNRP